MTTRNDKTFVQQIVQASENVIQVAGDYIQSTTINVRRGNWAAAIPQILLLLLIAVLLFRLLAAITPSFGEDIDLNSHVLNQGKVAFVGVYGDEDEVFLYAKNAGSYLQVFEIPLEEYRSKRIELGEGAIASGEILTPKQTYQFGTQGSDAFIQLDTNPTEEGEFVRGRLRGRVSDGQSKQKLDYELVLPVGGI